MQHLIWVDTVWHSSSSRQICIQKYKTISKYPLWLNTYEDFIYFYIFGLGIAFMNEWHLADHVNINMYTKFYQNIWYGWRTTAIYIFSHFYTRPYNSGRLLWFHVGRRWVCLSVVHLSVCFSLKMITSVNISGFSPNLVCALILWRSGLGLLMGKFRQFLTELSARDIPIFSFLDYNLSK